MIATKKLLSVLFISAIVASATATDYYVDTIGSDENDGLSAEAPFATIDKAIASATNAADVIRVAPGTYSTTTQYGPNLQAKLVGAGANRGDVIIQADGAHRTLRMAADSWLENVTVVGNTDISKADKGGAIEVNGGTITNCVLRDGKTYGNGDTLNKAVFSSPRIRQSSAPASIANRNTAWEPFLIEGPDSRLIPVAQSRRR